MLIFVSAEDVDHPLARGMIDRLAANGWDLDHSPRNPASGDDARWTTWYSKGCAEALARADVFVGIATPGWSASTWMAHEAEAALDSGLLRLLWNPEGVAIPAGLRPYAEHPLSPKLAEAVEGLAAISAAPQPSLTRHLARLIRFVQRSPPCPRWSSVLLAEQVLPTGPFTELRPPEAYVDRFQTLLDGRSWVNLHAVGIHGGALVVSVEASADPALSRAKPAPVQLSGPDARVRAHPSWRLPPTGVT
jgi:hypothetical protein